MARGDRQLRRLRRPLGGASGGLTARPGTTVHASASVTRSAQQLVPVGYSGPRTWVPLSVSMDPRPTPAEDLPALYRGILDGVARLERLGARREAGLLRADATRAFSTGGTERPAARLWSPPLRAGHRLDALRGTRLRPGLVPRTGARVARPGGRSDRGQRHRDGCNRRGLDAGRRLPQGLGPAARGVPCR